MEPAAPARNVVPLAALAIFLSRFVTPGIAPYAEPAVQAAFNLAIVLGVVVLGLVGSRWLTHLRASSPLLLLGVALYASAAALGGVVALARHNETNLVAGQFLSMGLLALAALGGWMNGGAAALKRFAAAISAMACVNCLAAMAFGAARLAHGQDPLRFSFPNGSAPTATALAAILEGLLGIPVPKEM